MDGKAHQWTDGGATFLLESDGSLYEVPEIGESPQCDMLPAFVAKEFFRLSEEAKAQQEARLALHREVRRAMEGARVAERARIREELLAAIKDFKVFLPDGPGEGLVTVPGEHDTTGTWIIPLEALVPALDRICGEEE